MEYSIPLSSEQFKLNVDVTTGGGEFGTYNYDFKIEDKASFQAKWKLNENSRFLHSYSWNLFKGKTYSFWLDDQDKINSEESSSFDQQPISEDEAEISNPIMDWVLWDFKDFFS